METDVQNLDSSAIPVAELSDGVDLQTAVKSGQTSL